MEGVFWRGRVREVGEVRPTTNVMASVTRESRGRFETQNLELQDSRQLLVTDTGEMLTRAFRVSSTPPRRVLDQPPPVHTTRGARTAEWHAGCRGARCVSSSLHVRERPIPHFFTTRLTKLKHFRAPLPTQGPRPLKRRPREDDVEGDGGTTDRRSRYE